MIEEIILIALLIILATICFAAGQWSREQDEEHEYITTTQLNAHITEDTEEHRELTKKLAILEKDYFLRYPCEYRKETDVMMEVCGYDLRRPIMRPACHYPTPEGGYTWDKDMLSKCAKCKVRKAPSAIEDIEGC